MAKECSFKDKKDNIKKIKMTQSLNWKFSSPENEGFHEVVTPDNSDGKVAWAFRLNLETGNKHFLKHKKLELNGIVVSGQIALYSNAQVWNLRERDSFYLPANQEVEIVALRNLVMYFGGSFYEDKGEFFVRKYDLSQKLDHIHQIHGIPPFKREVFMTIAQEDEGSRLICGVTEGEPGGWTSWPPHQHSNDLEEIYCYFDIPKPKFALQLISRIPGNIEKVFPVSTGDFVIIPEGYHPTCGMPGVKSCYFWIMAAHSPKRRRYDLVYVTK
jgi:5-deoxy-glucuronate isomerase